MKSRPGRNRSHLTAIPRRRPSLPMRWLADNGWLEGLKCLDYGCGRGYDAYYYGMSSWDPHWNGGWTPPARSFDVVTCLYVLNVVPPEER